MNSLCGVKNSLSCIPLYTHSLDTSIYYICSVLVTGKNFTGGNITFCSNRGNFFFLNEFLAMLEIMYWRMNSFYKHVDFVLLLLILFDT